MKSPINKILYYFGTAMLICFFAFVIISGLFEKTGYTLIVYNNKLSIELQIDGLNDPNHRINQFSPGDSSLDIPDHRIKIAKIPLYVLINQKDRNIVFVTDTINELNKYLEEKEQKQ